MADHGADPNAAPEIQALELPPPAYDDGACQLVAPPNYSCHVNLLGHFLIKRELDSPCVAAFSRKWRRAEVELRGTVLYVRTQSGGRSAPKERAYTLQAADAGIAVDYKGRSHVLRVRAEGEQFLMATSDLITVVNWVERLNTAIAISLALDDREDPKFRVLPITRKPPAPTFQAEFRRKWREEWLQPSRERRWLDHPQQYPEGQSPFLLPAAQGNELAATTTRRPLTLPMPAIADSRTDAPRSTTNIPGQIMLVVEPSRTGSVGSMVYVRIQPEPYVPSPKGSPNAASVRTNLDYIRGCSRALRYTSSWRGGYYIREGKHINIRDISTLAYMARMQG